MMDSKPIYSSHDSTTPGGGFPTCGQELAIIPRNVADPNGYYYILGLCPWASDREIARKCRQLLARHHPDGEDPDGELFLRIQRISQVLRNPQSRYDYEHVPEGSLYVDQDVLDFMERQSGRSVPQEGMTKPVRYPPFFDYFSEGHVMGDQELAASWYEIAVPYLARTGYQRRLKVLITAGRRGFYSRAGILRVERGREVSLESLEQVLGQEVRDRLDSAS